VSTTTTVMPALVAGIHVLTALQQRKTWMAGTSPAMTKMSVPRVFIVTRTRTSFVARR